MKKPSWAPKGLANALTILRICIIPFLLMLFMRGYDRAKTAESSAVWFYLGALALFGIAALTDHLDGRIARKRGVTDFGKFADPIADKLLILGTLFAFKYWGGLIPLWMLLVMALREVGVTALRSALVARGGRVISASQWGKYKTGSQIAVVILGIALLAVNSAGLSVGDVQDTHGPIFWMMLFPMTLTVVSGIEFLYNNRSQLRNLTSARG